MAGRADGELAGGRVQHQVAAGDELVGQLATTGPARPPAAPAASRSGPRRLRRPELAHHRGRVHAPAHHVTDQHAGPAGVQRDEIEPVAADPGPRGRQVAPDRCQSRDGGGTHQGALEGQRDVPLLFVEAGELVLGTLALADIPGDDAGADDGPATGAHRVQQDFHLDELPAAGHPERFVMLDPLTPADAGQQLFDLALCPGGASIDTSADRLLRGVAVHALRRRIPEGDHAVQGLGQDRIAGGHGDHDELADPLLRGLALADVPDRGRHQQPVTGLQRAEADLHRELGAITAQPAQFQPCAHWPHLLAAGVRLTVARVIGTERLPEAGSPPGGPAAHRGGSRTSPRFAR